MNYDKLIKQQRREKRLADSCRGQNAKIMVDVRARYVGFKFVDHRSLMMATKGLITFIGPQPPEHPKGSLCLFFNAGGPLPSDTIVRAPTEDQYADQGEWEWRDND